MPAEEDAVEYAAGVVDELNEEIVEYPDDEYHAAGLLFQWQQPQGFL